MVRNSAILDPLSVSFVFLFSVFRPFFIPFVRISCRGWGWVLHPLCLNPFLFLPLYVLEYLT